MKRPHSPLIRRVVSRYTTQRNATRSHVQAVLKQQWTGLGSWRDPDIDRFVEQAVPLVEAGQLHTANLTAAYLTLLTNDVLGTHDRPQGIPQAFLDGIRPGVSTADVYRRPADTLYSALAAGRPFPDALDAATARLMSTAAMDMQLASTHAARDVLNSNEQVVGYMRVTNGTCCELCDLASDQTYHTGDLMPIHNNCSCDVEPVFRDEQTLDLSTGTVDEDTGDKPAVEEHGELGPLLVVEGQNFTGPDDIAA